MRSAVYLEPILDELPPSIKTLRAEAAGEGYRFLERLVAEWISHETRFDREGESLLAAYVEGELVGIGGVTVDPALMGVLRMRRFYIHPLWRRHGIGRRLALSLLGRVECENRMVTVNAGTAEAPAFWEALGFMLDRHDGHTHVFDPQNGNVPTVSF
jgi:GNAT superfamily N-acetyltransferase